MSNIDKQAIDFSLPLETENGEPVKYVCHDVVEYKCARVCVDVETGIVYSSPYVGLKIRNTPLRKIIENAASAYADFENGFISDTTCIDRSHEYLVFVKEPKNVLALLDELEPMALAHLNLNLLCDVYRSAYEEARHDGLVNWGAAASLAEESEELKRKLEAETGRANREHHRGFMMACKHMKEHVNIHYADAAEMEIAALRQRITELEVRELTVLPGGFSLDEAKELHANLVNSYISKAISSEKMKLSTRNSDLAWIKEQLISAAWFVQASIEAHNAAGIGKGE